MNEWMLPGHNCLSQGSWSGGGWRWGPGQDLDLSGPFQLIANMDERGLVGVEQGRVGAQQTFSTGGA